MKKLITISVILLAAGALHGQISVTFTGTGAAITIDSVTATNLRTNQSVSFPGNETLVLTVNTGIPTVSESANMGVVYPNPFSGRTTFSATVEKPQSVYLKVQNLVGQVVAQTQSYAQPGENEFALSVNAAGIYMVSLTTNQGTSSYKVICNEAITRENSVQYLGSGAINDKNPSRSGLKSALTGYTIGYTVGDVILYRCRSGNYTTIVTDTLPYSKNYGVEFVGCTDPDGKNYPVVHIGTQTWMAENLAWLPSVSSEFSGSSDTLPFFYVYGNESNSVSEAKATRNYTTYGVLYNWPAALTACPSGWYLPSEDEWTTLADYLTNNGYGYGGSGSDIGKSMAATSSWAASSYAGTVGYDQASNNSSGFTALPGGVHFFEYLGYRAFFWTSSESGPYASYRNLNSVGDNLARGSDERSRGFSVRCLKDDAKPTARFTYGPVIGTTLTIFQFDASGSKDAETATADLEVRWDWNGDSIWDTRYDTLKTNSFQFPEIGSYRVILEVKDGDGLVDTETKTVTVADGTLTDPRDGHTYLYKTIGTQTWMAENLAWLPRVSPSSVRSETDPYYYVYGYEGSTVDSAKGTANYSTVGVLYNWPAAMNGSSGSDSVPSRVQGACPDGWHLPSAGEWSILTNYLGSGAGTKMKATSGWSYNGNGDNSSGFTALPVGNTAPFWSSSLFEYDSNPGCFFLYYGSEVNWLMSPYHTSSNGSSVRCLKDGPKPMARFTFNPAIGTTLTNFQFDASGSTDSETATANLEVRWDWNGDSIWDTSYDTLKTCSIQFPETGTYRVILEVKDGDGLVDTETKTVIVGDGILTDSRDGQDYFYKTIGTQTWMIENLAYLPAVSPSSAGSETDPYYYVYGYEGSTVASAKAAANYSTYGVLYNWEAAKTACPSGWKLPTDDEWKILEMNQGMSESDANAGGYRASGAVGGKLKESGTGYWNSPNYGANNSSGFTALPGGGRGIGGGVGDLGYGATFWSSSENGSNAWYRYLLYSHDGVGRDSDSRRRGFSVRCLRN